MSEDLKREAPQYPKQVFKYVMPMPPSVNHMYYNTRGGGKRLTVKAQKFFDEQRTKVFLSMHEQGWQLETGDVWFVFDLDFYQPDNRIRDTHNTLKIMMDVFDKVLIKNDYFAKTRIHKVELDRANPRVEITVYPENYIERGQENGTSKRKRKKNS